MPQKCKRTHDADTFKSALLKEQQVTPWQTNGQQKANKVGNIPK